MWVCVHGLCLSYRIRCSLICWSNHSGTDSVTANSLHFFSFRACVWMRLMFLFVLFQASPSSFVSGAIEGSHPAGTREQPPHHSGTVKQGQSTHKGKNTGEELLNQASGVRAVA